MIVVDTSILIDALVDPGPRGDAVARRLVGQPLAAPELIYVEAVDAIRGLVVKGVLTRPVGDRAIRELATFPLRRYSYAGLLPRIWGLRDDLSAYDAAYVALAERLGCALLTGDQLFCQTPGLRCPIELLG